MALTFTAQPTSRASIHSEIGQDKLCEEPRTASKKAPQYSFTRGAEYYRMSK
jgi:hypothetical protein